MTAFDEAKRAARGDDPEGLNVVSAKFAERVKLDEWNKSSPGPESWGYNLAVEEQRASHEEAMQAMFPPGDVLSP